MPPIPNENIATEKEGKDKVVLIKQVRDEQEKCADKNSPVAVFFGVINEKEYATQENNIAECKIERECGRDGKPIVSDRHVEDK
jgi:hypothetical protein